MISLIAAMDKNRVIGNKGDLPWRLPNDLKYFKEKTKGKIIIMGRKTFESLPGGPLPDRLNIIITRQSDYEANGAHVFTDKNEALKYCYSQLAFFDKEIFVIGGAEIYSLFLEKTSKIYLTEIFESFEGDTYFPSFDHLNFSLLSDDPHLENKVPYSFKVYERDKV